MKIISIVGARPNFMKVAPLHRAFKQNNSIQSKIIHTGQHFDRAMSTIFFEELELPEPDYFLGVGSGTHSIITAKIMTAIEPILQSELPDLVIVVGDVTSTLACALVANRNGIPVAHVEAGLRSFDRSMPEEINRLLTDQISDLLFTTERQATDHLMKENISPDKIHFVGNCMIDSLHYYQKKTSDQSILKQFNLLPASYVIMTMHRPSNVDTLEGLQKLIHLLSVICTMRTVLLPLHPRTKDRLNHFGLLDTLTQIPNLIITEPLGYIEFITLIRYSQLILTDSGGVQEETTYLGVPCLTFRKSTERPITVDVGTNILLDDLNPEVAIHHVREILDGHIKQGQIPELWDGQAAFRIRNILLNQFG